MTRTVDGPTGSLRQLLLTSRLLVSERAHVAFALGHGACWPLDAALRAAAARSTTGPRPTEVGETYGVTTSDGGRRASLYLLRSETTRRSASGARPLDRANRVPLVGAASDVAALVDHLVRRDMGPLHPSEMLERRRWFAELVSRLGDGTDVVVDGPSFGLALGLAQASRLLESPVPDSLLATCGIGANGRAIAVGDLERKMQLVVHTALGVDRVLVASAQLQETRDTLSSIAGGERVTAVGVGSLSEALGVVFGEVLGADALRARFADEERAASRAALLMNLALLARPLSVEWSSVAIVAEQLAQTLARRPESAARATLARDIAWRHTGRSALIGWPEASTLRSLPRPRRLRLVAQVVQSASDSDDASTRDYVARARAHLAPPEEATEGDWALRGALGRALATLDDLDGARAELDASIAGFLSVEDREAMSHALCERLRISGIERDRASVLRLAEIAEASLDAPELSLVSNGYLRLALARASLRIGELEDASTFLLGGFDWSLLPQGVQVAAMRARVGLVTGAAADHALGELERAHPSSADAKLARVDLLVARELDAGQAIDALLAHERAGREVARLRARLPPGVDLASWIVERYRY